jgi:mRNA interferase MazF
VVDIKRGDVILCDLNPVVGTEQAGIRPALIIQIDRANDVSPHTIIAPFTSKIRRALLPSHVFIPAGIGGLSQDSVILCEQIRAIDKSRIIRVIGHLDNNYIMQLGTALSNILGLQDLGDIE